MEEFLVALLQFVFELLGSIFTYLPFVYLPTGHERGKQGWEARLPLFVYVLVGGVFGWLSTKLLPHAALHYGWLRMINLAASPLLSGFYAQLLSGLRRKRHPQVLPCDHFWQAFWFSLGFVVLRFTYVARG